MRDGRLQKESVTEKAILKIAFQLPCTQIIHHSSRLEFENSRRNLSSQKQCPPQPGHQPGALAHLATHKEIRCPKLVWIVPQKRIVLGERKEKMKPASRTPSFKKPPPCTFCARKRTQLATKTPLLCILIASGALVAAGQGLPFDVECGWSCNIGSPVSDSKCRSVESVSILGILGQ